MTNDVRHRTGRGIIPIVLERRKVMLCKKCGKNPCYERNGRVFALCASCGWSNLMMLLDLPDRATEQRNEAEGGAECPYCLDTHVLLDGDEERTCWYCYDFEP